MRPAALAAVLALSACGSPPPGESVQVVESLRLEWGPRDLRLVLPDSVMLRVLGATGECGAVVKREGGGFDITMGPTSCTSFPVVYLAVGGEVAP